MDDNNKNEVQEPDFSGEELKMPEEQFGSTTIEEPKQQSSAPNMGPFIAILAIILVAVLVGLYLWSRTFITTPSSAPAPQIERPSAAENNEPESTTAEVETQSLNVVSNSTDLNAIEADLESTNLDNLDAEMQAIETELDAGLIE